MEFTEIPEYKDYSVSKCGVVLSRKNGKESILKGYINSKGYKRFNLMKGNVADSLCLHQIIAITFMGHKIDGHKIVVDHINNNQSDNRIENLQLITSRENRTKDSSRLSKFTGLSLHKSTGKWRVRITINRKRVDLGLFSCELKGAAAYNNALKQIK